MAKKSKFDYFDAFAELTKLALAETDLLIDAIEQYSTADDLLSVMERAHELEHQADDLGHEIFTNVATDFITPIEREDIIALVQNLDDVIDDLEDVVQCFYMYNITRMHDDALTFAQIIKNACQALDNAMEHFRDFKKNKQFRSLIVQVNDCEEEGDRLYLLTIRKLFTQDNDKAMYAHVWSDIFSRMERCCDMTEHVADVMSTVLLKNS